MNESRLPVGLGIHYFPDEDHFGEKDLDIWIPELKSLDFRWLALSGSISRAIPEIFLKGLTDAGIEPVLLLDREPISNPKDNLLTPILRSYQRAGVRFIVPFPAPNLSSSWPAGNPQESSPVTQFVNIFSPVAETILAEGITPVFPMVEPTGGYWGLAFLEGCLSGLVRDGHNDLARKMALAVNFSSYNRPLDWGAGGPLRWPEARPYLTPPGSQDHLGFQGYLWADDAVRRVLGESLPMIGLKAGATAGDMTDPDFPPVDPIRQEELNLQVAQIAAASRFSAPVLSLCFWLLSADPDSPQASEAWFRCDGSILPIVESLKRRALSKTTRNSLSARKPFRHYLLLPQDAYALSDGAWASIRKYISAFQPVCGFSIDEASQAQRVTIFGDGASSISKLRLQECGCHVEYLASERI
jgi:hypothetical protein